MPLQLNSGASAFHIASGSPAQSCLSHAVQQQHLSDILPCRGLPTIVIAAPTAEPVRMKTQAVQRVPALFGTSHIPAIAASPELRGDFTF